MTYFGWNGDENEFHEAVAHTAPEIKCALVQHAVDTSLLDKVLRCIARESRKPRISSPSRMGNSRKGFSGSTRNIYPAAPSSFPVLASAQEKAPDLSTGGSLVIA